MASLSAKKRSSLPPTDFAIPSEEAYPIDTIARGRNALARVSQFGNSAQKAQVSEAVHKRYPEIGNAHSDKIPGKKESGK